MTILVTAINKLYKKLLNQDLLWSALNGLITILNITKTADAIFSEENSCLIAQRIQTQNSYT